MNPSQDLPNLGNASPEQAAEYGKMFVKMYVEEVTQVLGAFLDLDPSVQTTIVGLYVQLRFR